MLEKEGSRGKNVLKWQTFRLSFVFGLAFFLSALSWFYSLYPINGINNTEAFILVTLAWLILCLLFSLMLAILGAFAVGFHLNTVWRIIIFSCGWVILEYLQGKVFGGFPWLRLGISQYQYLAIIQSASLFGAMWISALIIMVNGFLAATILNKKARYFIIAVVIFGINLGYGIYALNQHTNIDKTLDVGIVQGNIDYNERFDKTKQQLVLDTYVGNSIKAVQAAGKLDMILWPETVLPYIVQNGNGIAKQYADLANRLNTNLYIGGFSQYGIDIYNSLLEVTPENDYGSTLKSIYVKQHLVPFAESVPMRDFFQTIAPNIMSAKILDGNLSKGSKEGVVHSKVGNMGVMICFDSVFSASIREQVVEGAEFLVVSTNETWFGTSPALVQHNAHAVFRSVEFGRYLVRSTNGGISCIIDDKGHIIKSMKPNDSGYIIGTILLLNQTTLYSLIGESIVLIAVFIILLAFILSKNGKYSYLILNK